MASKQSQDTKATAPTVAQFVHPVVTPAFHVAISPPDATER